MIEDKIIIETGDITEFAGDAIVNAANTDLILGSGVAGAIREKGGYTIQAECNKTGSIALGDVTITPAGDLKCKFIIHAAGMHLGGRVNEESLRSCIHKSLKVADQFNVRTLAFPAIGTGVGGFPLENCAETMLSVVKEYLQTQQTGIEKVYFILFDYQAFTVFNNYFQNM